MQSCQNAHSEIMFSGKTCPLCIARDECDRLFIRSKTNKATAILEALKIQYKALETANYTFVYYPIQDEIKKLNQALINLE